MSTHHAETFLADVGRFMLAGDQTLTARNTRQLALYIGLQLEEMAEKLEALAGPSAVLPLELVDTATTVVMLHRISKQFKSGALDETLNAITDEQRKEMLDADFDLAWVSVGAAYSLGAKVKKAWAEGTRSNLAKLGPDGRMAKDENGKIKKPAGWTPPDFSQCLYVV